MDERPRIILGEIAENLRASLNTQGTILKEIGNLTVKNTEQDEALQFLKSRNEIINSQLTEIQRILKQFAEADLESRLEQIEKSVSKQQTLISLFSSVPRPLQWLVLTSTCISAIAWSVKLLSK